MSLVAPVSPACNHRTRISRFLSNASRCEVASIPVDRLTLPEATAWIIESLWRNDKPTLVMGPNAQLITLAQRDQRFATALKTSSLNIPDGVSVVLASKLLGQPTPERVTGGDLMESLCRSAAHHGLSAFFLGGLPQAAQQAAHHLQQLYPGLTIAGTYCPPPGFEHDPVESEHIRRLIIGSAPDLLFVAFGAPKQEIWMYDHCQTLPIGAALSVGAAFDTQAGLRKRAPQWTRKLCLEWLYRLIQEPRRLWRRYLFGNTYFLYLIGKQYFRQILNYKTDAHPHFIQLSLTPALQRQQPEAKTTFAS